MAFNFYTSHTGVKNQKVYSPKTKLPTQSKSIVGYCFNCNARNKSSAKVCIQCECTIHKLSKRKLR